MLGRDVAREQPIAVASTAASSVKPSIGISPNEIERQDEIGDAPSSHLT